MIIKYVPNDSRAESGIHANFVRSYNIAPTRSFDFDNREFEVEIADTDMTEVTRFLVRTGVRRVTIYPERSAQSMRSKAQF